MWRRLSSRLLSKCLRGFFWGGSSGGGGLGYLFFSGGGASHRYCCCSACCCCPCLPPPQTRGFHGKLGALGLYTAKLGAFLGSFGGYLSCHLHPNFWLTALGYRVGCGVCCAVWGRKGAPIGGQTVLGSGLPRPQRGVNGKLGGSRPYSANLGVFLGSLGGYLCCHLHPNFWLMALGYRAGCGLSCSVWGGKGALIGGQKVLGSGLPQAQRGVNGKLGDSGPYSANLGLFLGSFRGVYLVICIPSFGLPLWAAGRVVGFVVLFG